MDFIIEYPKLENLPDDPSELRAQIKTIDPFIHKTIISEGYSDFAPSQDAYLVSINVEKSRRNEGIGTKLLKYFEDKCREQDVRKIVGRFNPNKGKSEELFNFYAKNGYTLKLATNGNLIILDEMSESIWRDIKKTQSSVFFEKTVALSEN